MSGRGLRAPSVGIRRVDRRTAWCWRVRTVGGDRTFAPIVGAETAEDAEHVAGTLVSELVAGPVHVAAAERLHPMRLHVREGIRALARKYAA